MINKLIFIVIVSISFNAYSFEIDKSIRENQHQICNEEIKKIMSNNNWVNEVNETVTYYNDNKDKLSEKAQSKYNSSINELIGFANYIAEYAETYGFEECGNINFREKIKYVNKYAKSYIDEMRTDIENVNQGKKYVEEIKNGSRPVSSFDDIKIKYEPQDGRELARNIKLIPDKKNYMISGKIVRTEQIDDNTIELLFETKYDISQGIGDLFGALSGNLSNIGRENDVYYTTFIYNKDTIGVKLDEIRENVNYTIVGTYMKNQEYMTKGNDTKKMAVLTGIAILK